MGIFQSKVREPPRPSTRVNIHPGSGNYQSSRPTPSIIGESVPRVVSSNYVRDIECITRNLETLSTHERASTYARSLSGSSNRNIQSSATRHIPAPEISKKENLLFLDPLLRCPVVTYTPLSPYDQEYLAISRMVTNKKYFKIDSIQRINNNYLETAYELKKIQKQSQYLYVEERLLFHGTKQSNIQTICEKNFNWRLCQADKYGTGVSFSPNSTYASNYSDKHTYDKVLIVAKVMIAKSCFGYPSMPLPDAGCDTSQKGEDGIVIVKFDDNEFCPLYQINYHVTRESFGQANRHRNINRRMMLI